MRARLHTHIPTSGMMGIRGKEEKRKCFFCCPSHSLGGRQGRALLAKGRRRTRCFFPYFHFFTHTHAERV